MSIRARQIDQPRRGLLGHEGHVVVLIARDTMHQQQWLAVIEELGGPAALPIPNSFDQGQEKAEFSYAYLTYGIHGADVPEGRWSEGPSIDGRAEFHLEVAQPLGDEPVLSAPAPEGYAQTEQRRDAPVAQSPDVGSSTPEQQGGGMIGKLKDAVS
jgi:Mn-containing catalase